MGIETAATLAVIAASSAYAANRQHEMQNTAQRASATADRQAEQLTQHRQGAVNQIRDLYGVGSDPTAKQNASDLAGKINDYYNAQLTNNLKGTEDQFSNASRVSRQNLARTGQLGSSLDASSQSSNLADFIRSRQNAVSQAAASKSTLESQLTNQRLGLEGQINTGAMSNPDYGSIVNQQQSVLNQAQSQIAPNAAANLFNIAGNTYFQGAQQSALGNQGLGAFWGGSGGNGSSGGGQNTSR